MTFLILYIVGAVLSIWPLDRGFKYMVKNDFPLSYAKGEASSMPFVVIGVLIWPIGILLAVLLLFEANKKGPTK